jgi:hypothetical protein
VVVATGSDLEEGDRHPREVLVNLFRTVTGLSAGLLAAGLLTAPASADPPRPASTREFGNGPERHELAATVPDTSMLAALTAPDTRWTPQRQGYPRRNALREYPENPADKAIKLGLVPYHGIAPRLNASQNASDRVSAEVVGQSALGRDLYLVTVTAPETAAEAARQDRWRALIEDDPAAARRDRALARGYKTPVWINANIHGDEWRAPTARCASSTGSPPPPTPRPRRSCGAAGST